MKVFLCEVYVLLNRRHLPFSFGADCLTSAREVQCFVWYNVVEHLALQKPFCSGRGKDRTRIKPGEKWYIDNLNVWSLFSGNDPIALDIPSPQQSTEAPLYLQFYPGF